MNIHFEKLTAQLRKDPLDDKRWSACFFLAEKESDEKERRKMCAILKQMIGENLSKGCRNAEQLSTLYTNILLLEARHNVFDSYMQFLELKREPSKRFWLPRREQLLPVCESIQKLIDGDLDILSISLPPGTGKSTLEIFLHTMLIGHNPDSPSLASGHSGVLTRSIFDGVLGIISDDMEYNWREVFPKAGEIITNSQEQTIDITAKHRFSSLTCRPINGSLTGATRCEQILTADDLVSGIEEAMSIDRLTSLWQKYTNDLKSRKKLGCKELHLATRWSVHDVIGRLNAEYEDDPRCQFLVVPALDKDGESNFNYKYNVGFDKKYFLDMKANLDDASFKALFMNQPIEREGLLYHPDELKRYFELPEGEPDGIVAVCDTKEKGTDDAVLPVAYIYGDMYYIEDVICDDGLPDTVDARLIDILIKHNVGMCRIESNMGGSRLAEKIQKGVRDGGARTHILTKYTTANKETKIIINSAWVKEHCVFKDESKYGDHSEYGRFINKLCSYTLAGKNKHDDVPDAMSMLAEFIQSRFTNNCQVIPRPF